MLTLLQDLKYALRMFRENPVFTLAAISALALGIGANIAIFSVVNAVLLKPLPYPDPDRLVLLIDKGPEGQNTGASPAEFIHWARQTDVLEHIAAYRNGNLNLTGGDVPELLSMQQVSREYFQALGREIIRGRSFSEEEDLPTGPLTVVLGEDFWKQRFNGDDAVLGTEISLDGRPHTIIGVASAEPNASEIGTPPQVYTAFRIDPNTSDHGNYFQTLARLKDGVSLEQAQERLQASTAAFLERFPDSLGENITFSVQTFHQILTGGSRTMLLVMMGAVGFVLLIACANVANLLMVRATARRREIAIRAAVGAQRGRLIRQLLTESVLLSFIGGAIGLALGMAGIHYLLTVSSAGLPRLGAEGTLLGMDWRVLAFTLGVSLATGILFGMIPALQASRTDMNSVIKDAGSRTGSGFRQNKTRSVLVVVEVGLAVVLLIGSALLIRTSVNLSSVDPGFTAENVLTMRTALSGPRFDTSAGVDLVTTRTLEGLRAIPGVLAATATCCVPMQGGFGLPFNVVGRPNEGPATGGAGYVITAPGYFDTFQIPVVRGRAFNERDSGAAPPVVLINETMARRFWTENEQVNDPNADPLNDRLVIGRGLMREFATEPERQIVGIVGDIRYNGLENEPNPIVYVPQAQIPDAVNALGLSIIGLKWVVRTQSTTSGLSSAIQEEIRDATGLPVTDIQSMEETVYISTQRQRFNMILMTVFGSSALLLAAIGIFGLMAYTVQQQTREIGIRLALGADTAKVRNGVIRRGLGLSIAGVVIGVAGAYGLAQYLDSVLYEVEPRDPLVFITIPIALLLISLLAVWIPARRASKVDPMIALRYE